MRRAWLIVAVALALTSGVSVQQVELKIDETFSVKGKEIRYGLDLGIEAVAPTRMGVAAMLDLTDLQGQLPELLAGLILVDNCGLRIALERIEAEAQESTGRDGAAGCRGLHLRADRPYRLAKRRAQVRR